jgi:O-antigen/teichoic acid export membrane protein
MTYVWIVAASTVAPAFWNFRRIRTYVVHRFSLAGWNNHLFLMARFLVISVICSFAASLPMTYIGYMWSDRDLGIFTMAYRVLMISLMVVGSLGAVLLPYLSGVRANDEAHFDRIVNQIFLAINLVAVPASLGIWLLSDRIALILGGDRFLEAGKLISYLSIILLLSVNSSFLVQQVMYPRGEEGRILKITIAVSIVAAIVDFFLVRHLGTLGASIGLVFSESLILFLVGFHVFKKRLVVVEPVGLWKIVAATATMGGLVFFTQRHFPSGHQYTVLICIIGGFVYTCALLLLREKTLYFVLNRIANLARRDQ